MGRMWWLVFNAFAIGLLYAAPRELSTDELITKPRPGEEYVHIQTSSKNKVDLVDQSFTTSHRIPELSKTNRSEDFQTSHRIPLYLERAGRSLPSPDQKVDFTTVEGTTNESPLERVVTRTSIKMSKSKKVQKSVVKAAHDGLIDIKADEGLIDERAKVDEEEREIMKKKFLKSEKVDFSPPTRFNVPFEDEEKVIDFDTSHLIIPNPVIATTQEPPITTFNYKNVYDKSRKGKGFVTNNENVTDKYKFETLSSESIKTAESKTIISKKDSKQEKKDKYKDKEESGFYVLPVNKQQENFKEDNYDFVDVEEKVLVPAGSSPSQSSRINIKKGPNGQEYEYEYVYYYYDEDDDAPSEGGSSKEGKVVQSTSEKVYNGHDGPAKEDQEQNSVQSTSTNGNKYLPTESSKPILKSKPKTIEVREEIEDDVPAQNFVSKNSRGGTNSNRFSSSGRQTESRTSEPASNEVYPSGARSQSRSRGRSSSSSEAQEEEIPSIGEERLPANTRFPPRSRVSNAPVTPPQPQETAARARGREGSNQSRLRIPNLGLLDSSSFRTHASDASIEDDALRETEFQRKANARGTSTETRRGTRPTTDVSIEDVPAVTRRPAIRKPVEDRRPRPTLEEEEEEEIIEEKRYKSSFEEGDRKLKVPQEETGKKPRVPLEEEVVETPKVPLEEEGGVRRPQVPLEKDQDVRRPPVPLEEQQRPTDISGEAPLSNERRPQPQTTRESDAEEGVFPSTQAENTSFKSSIDQNSNPESKTWVSTTEDPSVPGLTGVMMEKVALDLYAILQQAQNENIQTNFVDGNSTDITTDSGEGQTEYSSEEEGYTAEPIVAITTTTTTTTTTTPPPTTTTTTPAPTQAPGRGRYRGRVANGSKIKSKASTTTTTEATQEVSSPRTRGRFQPNHGTRGSGLTFARKPTKSSAKEQIPEEAPVSEETPKAAPERSFGERPRSRFRTSGRVTTVAPSTAAPSASSSASLNIGNRAASADRLTSRRRGGGRAGLPTIQHSAVETHTDEERQDIHQEAAVVAEEPAPATPLRPTRPRIGGSVRPLRPGPRAPSILSQRGQQAAVASSTALPAEQEELEKEVVETEVQAQHTNEEGHDAQTPSVGDALTRLKSRPRLRIGANANHQKPQTPPPPPQSRRKLVSSLLPKRKPNEEKPVEKVEETEERTIPEEIPVEEDLASAIVEPSSSTAEPEPKGLSGLLAGRRRTLNRRPGTIYSRAQPTEA